MSSDQHHRTNQTSSKIERQAYQAYIAPNVIVPPTGEGRLNGARFALKDVVAVAGHTNAAGNPDWLRTHEAAPRHAEVVRRLLAAGAALDGMTHTDELMYSLNGENAHYGTPINPADSMRIPGGSSSGSAVAAAADDIEFAIGTDTGGSVRIPSSYCGVYGFRPTHGMVSLDGVIPLAHSFDTVGWMSRKLQWIVEVGEVLLADESDPAVTSFHKIYMDEEIWAVPEAADRDKLLAHVGKLQGDYPLPLAPVHLTDQVWKVWMEQSLYSVPEEYASLGQGLILWSQAFRLLQGMEIWREHGTWVTRHQPVFGSGIAERLKWTSTLREADVTWAQELRTVLRAELSSLLGVDGLLVLPTAPGVAPLRGLQGEEAEVYRAKVMQLSCIAGLAGLPQLTVPVWREDGLPIGVSFVAAPGRDRALLHWVAARYGDIRVSTAE
ncbi:amidase [Paenibacillus sp. NPDC056722]|uniref:amidase n=1 Tax=Paenibacillus sp. NPDC056722 TaxID=3345924 RepID=UPI0036808CF4